MTRKLVALTLSALFVFSITALAAPKDAPAAQKIDLPSLGSVSCIASSIEKNADGTLKKCVLTANKVVPGADVLCLANKPIVLNQEGKLAQCTLGLDRSFPDPVGITCDDGYPIEFHPDGTLAKCMPVTEKKSAVLGGNCAVGKTIEFYPDAQLKECVSLIEKAVPETTTKELYVSNFVCAKNNVIAFNEKGRVQKCVPTDSVYMRGKGTCLPGEVMELQADGKVKECTYTYPLYQNKSCKVEARVSFHPNGFFKDCTLPEDKQVGSATCKADAFVSYNPNGTVASCTLAAPAEKVPGTILPAGTKVEFDANNKIR